MVQEKDLEELARASYERVDLEVLSDLLKAEVSGETPVERLESLLAQGINPYYFRVGQTPVRLVFHEEEGTLEEKLRTYFLALKRGSRGEEV